MAAFDQMVDILPFPKRALMIQRKTETEVLVEQKLARPILVSLGVRQRDFAFTICATMPLLSCRVPGK